MEQKKTGGDQFFSWLTTRNIREIEVFIEEIPKIFLQTRNPDIIAATLKNEEKSKQWRESYLSEIQNYFKDKGLNKKHLAGHMNRLKKCFDRVFKENKFFVNAADRDMQWSMYVTGWFLMGMTGAIAVKNGNQAYEPLPLDPYDAQRSYA